jgi:hypothetical protein
MKKYGIPDVAMHVFLTSALVQVSSQLHTPAALPLEEKKPYTYWKVRYVGPGATGGYEEVKILDPTGSGTISRSSNYMLCTVLPLRSEKWQRGRSSPTFRRTYYLNFQGRTIKLSE